MICSNVTEVRRGQDFYSKCKTITSLKSCLLISKSVYLYRLFSSYIPWGVITGKTGVSPKFSDTLTLYQSWGQITPTT